MDILALDFDGVLCDSAKETGSTGWECCTQLWPETFSGNPPEALLDKFRQVRPVLKTGYESILLVRLLFDGFQPEDILDDATFLTGKLMHDEALQHDVLIRLFGTTRDRWINDDLDNWLAVHEFFDGTVDAVNSSTCPAYIITTKEKRFAVELCRAAQLEIPAENVYGLESGEKTGVLADLLRQHDGATLHFVEDRLKALKKVLDAGMTTVRLYFAEWGYNTEKQREKALELPQIHVLRQADFAEFTRSPSDFLERK